MKTLKKKEYIKLFKKVIEMDDLPKGWNTIPQAHVALAGEKAERKLIKHGLLLKNGSTPVHDNRLSKPKRKAVRWFEKMVS